MSDWTLGGVKVHNMEINALCEQEGCRHLFVFNLDRLIEGVGPGYLIADIPPMACPQCGSPLAIRLSFADPPAGGGGLAHRRRSVGLGKAKRAHRDSFRVGNGQAVAHLT